MAVWPGSGSSSCLRRCSTRTMDCLSILPRESLFRSSPVVSYVLMVTDIQTSLVLHSSHWCSDLYWGTVNERYLGPTCRAGNITSNTITVPISGLVGKMMLIYTVNRTHECLSSFAVNIYKCVLGIVGWNFSEDKDVSDTVEHAGWSWLWGHGVKVGVSCCSSGLGFKIVSTQGQKQGSWFI